MPTQPRSGRGSNLSGANRSKGGKNSHSGLKTSKRSSNLKGTNR